MLNVNGKEILRIEIANCTITSVHKPLTVPSAFRSTNNFNNLTTKIIISDFNSHHTEWGYENKNDDGD